MDGSEKMTWNDDLTVRQIAARDHVHDALDALGGMASPGGSYVWHVVGLQMSLRERAMSAWDPARGEGHMTRPLTEYFARVEASDIHDYGLSRPDRSAA